MDDIFSMSAKRIDIKDINEMAQRVNVKNTFMPKTSDALEVEYCDGIMANWFCMNLENFQEVEDKKFLIDEKIESIFCISCHPSSFSFILPHIKAVLEAYGGWIGKDGDGFQPCFNLQGIERFKGTL